MNDAAERRLIEYLNRPGLDGAAIDEAFEQPGRDIGAKLGAALAAGGPYESADDVLAISGIGPKRLALMLDCAADPAWPDGRDVPQPARPAAGLPLAGLWGHWDAYYAAVAALAARRR